MKSFGKIMTCFVLGVLIQGGVYYYLDHVYLAPSTDFEVSSGDKTDEDTKGKFPEVGEGKKYYSHDKEYMAVVKTDSVKIYTSGKSDPININLKGRTISYFEWMPDRNQAIMGLHDDDNDVILAQLDPESPDHEKDTKIEDLPSQARLVDVAYSTATNVVYMKVKVSDNAFRIYRTDANYDTRRVYMQASNIGRIAVFYDEDKFFYDNVKTGDVFMFDGVEGGWRVINPNGRYRLIGVDKDQNIYIAHVDKEDKVLSISVGKLGVGFKTLYKYDTPIDLSGATLASVKELIANSNPDGTDLESKDSTDEKTSSDSDSKTKKK